MYVLIVFTWIGTSSANYFCGVPFLRVIFHTHLIELSSFPQPVWSGEVVKWCAPCRPSPAPCSGKRTLAPKIARSLWGHQQKTWFSSWWSLQWGQTPPKKSRWNLKHVPLEKEKERRCRQIVHFFWFHVSFQGCRWFPHRDPVANLFEFSNQITHLA